MLEFFRRHRGAFLITLTTIIIISFAVWGGSVRTNPDYQKRAQPGDVAMTVYGKDVTIADVQRAQGAFMFCYRFMQFYELPMQLQQLSGGGNMNAPEAPLVNLFVARHLMEQYGIRVSDEEARTALTQLPVLQTDGKFDVSRGQMLEEAARSQGFDSDALLQIMKDSIGLRKLEQLATGNYVASPTAAEKQYASNYHTFKGSKITFETETFKKSVQVSDEEMKKYYDEKKDQYMTAEKRAVDYVLIENPKDLEKKPLEERQKAQNDVAKRVDDLNKLAVAKSLKEAAAQTKDKVESVPAFAEGEPPAALKDERELLSQVFASSGDSKAVEMVQGSNGWFIFTVSKIESPRQQELAEVKDKIKQVLENQKASEATAKAVNDARQALNEGLKAGKKIEDLVKEKNLKLEPLPDLDIANPQQDVPNAYLIVKEAAKAAPNTIANPVIYDNGTLLVYVKEKELRKRPDSATIRQNQVEFLTNEEGNTLFNAWFQKRYEEAKVKMSVAVS